MRERTVPIFPSRHLGVTRACGTRELPAVERGGDVLKVGSSRTGPAQPVGR